MHCPEEHNWAPSHWSAVRRRRYLKHVRERATWEVATWLSQHDARLFLAEFNALVDAARSLDELHARGFRTIGESDGLC